MGLVCHQYFKDIPIHPKSFKSRVRRKRPKGPSLLRCQVATDHWSGNHHLCEQRTRQIASCQSSRRLGKNLILLSLLTNEALLRLSITRNFQTQKIAPDNTHDSWFIEHLFGNLYIEYRNHCIQYIYIYYMKPWPIVLNIWSFFQRLPNSPRLASQSGRRPMDTRPSSGSRWTSGSIKGSGWMFATRDSQPLLVWN